MNVGHSRHRQEVLIMAALLCSCLITLLASAQNESAPGRTQLKAYTSETAPRFNSSLRAPAPGELTLEHIEITQAVQDINNSIKLLAGKRTVVRAYFSYEPTHPDEQVSITAKLRVKRGAPKPEVLVEPTGSLTVDPTLNGRRQFKRENAKLSLNFPLKESLASGRIDITLEGFTNTETSAEINCTNCSSSRTLNFSPSPPMVVSLIGLRYRVGAATYAPSEKDYALIESWLKRVYPSGNITVTSAVMDIPAEASWSFKCEEANAQLLEIQNKEVWGNGGKDILTHYYGVVADGGGTRMRGCASNSFTIPNLPPPVASGPTGTSGYDWDRDGSFGDWMAGHELAHTLGREHPGFPASLNGKDDRCFNFAGGAIADIKSDDVGFDVGDPLLGIPMAALPGRRWNDIMTYLDNRWISSYTYDGLYKAMNAERQKVFTPQCEQSRRDFVPKLNASMMSGSYLSAIGGDLIELIFRSFQQEEKERAAAAKAQVQIKSGDFINVVAIVKLRRTVDERNEGKITSINRFRSAPEMTIEETKAKILLRNKQGEVISDYPVLLQLNTRPSPEEDQTGMINAFIPLAPDTSSIEVVVDGDLIDKRMVSRSAPQITNLQMLLTETKIGSKTSPFPLVFSWEAKDADGDDLTYDVEMRIDNGEKWQTVLVNSSETSVTLDPKIEGLRSIMIRVTASDGFNSSNTSKSFDIPAY